MTDAVSGTEPKADSSTTIRALVDLIGFSATEALLSAKGGQRLHVPVSQNAASLRMLAEIVGETGAAALRLAFGGTAVDLPICPAAADPFWKRHRLPTGWEVKVHCGVDDFDATAAALAQTLVERFEGYSFQHIKRLTEEAVATIGMRTVVCPATVFLPDADAEGPPRNREPQPGELAPIERPGHPDPLRPTEAEEQFLGACRRAAAAEANPDRFLALLISCAPPVRPEILEAGKEILRLKPPADAALSAEKVEAIVQEAKKTRVELSLQKGRESLKRFLVSTDKFCDLSAALPDFLDKPESDGRNALHFLADHLGLDGGKRVFVTLVLACPDLVLEALDDGEG